ncbi:MAG: mechanosensitive ion channel [Thermoanaerobaculia bacterium]|nr:mechanosensitive ion channel [Thermoanaerobaculia bacterium]
MKLPERTQEVLGLLNQELFEIAGTSINLYTLITFVVVIVLSFWAASFLERAVMRVFTLRGSVEKGSAAASSRLVYYLSLVIGFGVAVQSVGVNLTALFAAGAIFAVAIGFAMQNLAQNFVSGIILLLERSIKPGDVLNVNGRLVRVEEMGIRATIARTLDEEHIILPNAHLVTESVVNYTLRDPFLRVRATVGVVYSSDMARVKRVLEEVAGGLSWRSQHKAPRVMLTEFADSAVVFEVSVWIESPWDRQPRLADLNEAIWRALGEAGVVIAFPQLDVHFDPPVTEALRGLRASA